MKHEAAMVQLGLARGVLDAERKHLEAFGGKDAEAARRLADVTKRIAELEKSAAVLWADEGNQEGENDEPNGRDRGGRGTEDHEVPGLRG